MGNGTYWDGEAWSTLQVDSPFDKAKVFVQALEPADVPMRTGDLFVDTDTRKVKFRNGATWEDISAGLEVITIPDVTGLTAALAAKADGTATTTSLGLKADKASPTFTGTVTVPTPAVDDNTTKAASTAYVQTELLNLDGSKLTSGTVPIARIPTGSTSTTVPLGNHTHTLAAGATDVAASAAELNILNGVTVTSTKINYLTDVTSNIQAQMDLKAPKANPVFTGTTTGVNRVESPDGDRTNTRLPTSSPRQVRYDFTNAANAGVSGNYAGVMTYAPWDGTSGSTGDASYQLAFGGTAVNGGGVPKLNIRKGIDSTWNSWYTIYHSGNTHSHDGDDLNFNAVGVEPTTTSWNSLTNIGVYPNLMHGTANPNGPGWGYYYYVTTYSYGGPTANVTQVATPYSNADIAPTFQRNRYSGVWSAWGRFDPEVDVVAGSNANGSYWKYGDGRLECQLRFTVTINSTTVSYDWTYPMAFVAGSTPAVNIVASTTVPQNLQVSTNGNPAYNTVNFRLYRSTSSGSSFDAYAYGRWK